MRGSSASSIFRFSLFAPFSFFLARVGQAPSASETSGGRGHGASFTCRVSLSIYKRDVAWATGAGALFAFAKAFPLVRMRQIKVADVLMSWMLINDNKYETRST